MLKYRSLAETWRVMTLYRLRNRAEMVANNIRAETTDPWYVVSFFYPKNGVGNRLSDEDFREIYFLLTDAYPEEVEANPDPIDLLTSLSETVVTEGHAKAIVDRMHKILEADDNEVRAWLIRPLFDRINKRDLHPLFMRLSIRAAPVRRRDVVRALGMAYDQPFHHVRTSVNLLGLRNTVRDLNMGSFNYNKIRPIPNMPLLIPSPNLVESTDAVAFTRCYAEIVEGVWATLHHSPSGTVGFSASGEELPDDDGWMERWASSLNLPEGVYLVDYAEHRENPMLLIDWLNPDDPKATYTKRRRRFNDIPAWGMKSMTMLEAPYHARTHIESGLPFILRNARGMLTYENTIEEIALLNPVSKDRILRVLSGRVIDSTTGGAPRKLWKLGVRDGFDYYPVCEMESDFDFNNYCASYKMIDGEAIKIDTPLFVTVDILSSGWGDIGAYVMGTITGIKTDAGISECMGVEEIGYVEDTESE